MVTFKVITITLLIAMLAVFPVGKAMAASSGETSLGTGTILSIMIDTDLTTGISTVLVSLMDDTETAQTIRISLETAISLGLVIPNEELIGQDVAIMDPMDATIIVASGVINSLVFLTDETTGITTLTVNLTDASDVSTDFILDLETAIFNDLVTTNELMIGTDVIIDPILVLDSSTFGKVVSKLGAFFASTLGVDFATLEAYQAEGYGYGVITQASWMATMLGGDAETLAQILAAKSSGDFSAFVLADGTTPTNWGQLCKAVLVDGKQNLGQIMSGKAEQVTTSTETTTENETMETKTNNGNSNSNDKTNNGSDNAANHRNNTKD